MRLLKLKAPFLALILAVLAVVVLQALSIAVGYALRPETSVNLLDRTIQLFYMPAWILTFLCMPSRYFDKGVEPSVLLWIVAVFFALTQWFLIFLAGIGIYRHFHKRHHEDFQAG